MATRLYFIRAHNSASRLPKLSRAASSSTSLPSNRYLKPSKPLSPAISSNPSDSSNPSTSYDPSTTETPTNLTPSQKSMIDSAIRIDQAGEIAANWIYKGQLAVLGRDPKVGPLIEEMWEQEKKHLKVMDKLQIQHDVRPTILTEVAKVAGFGLGAVTALMGNEAAMACTEAVETVIGEHYDDQIRDLEALEPLHSSIPLLRGVLQEFRDDELEHLDTAVDHHSQRTPHHALLTTMVEGGCRIAIALCRRI